MTPSYELTTKNVAGQVSEIRATIDRLCEGLSVAQLNWQPERGGRWSIGQCLDHVATSTLYYGGHISHAVVSAPPALVPGARPNPLGRAFVWLLEPPVKIRTSAPKAIQPKSTCSLDAVRRQLQDGWTLVEDLTARAVLIDSARVRFANPLAGGRRVFNVAAGVFVILAHSRRHLLQAERVKARPDFPSA